jgi:hypothetical protein
MTVNTDTEIKIEGELNTFPLVNKAIGEKVRYLLKTIKDAEQDESRRNRFIESLYQLVLATRKRIPVDIEKYKQDLYSNNVPYSYQDDVGDNIFVGGMGGFLIGYICLIILIATSPHLSGFVFLTLLVGTLVGAFIGGVTSEHSYHNEINQEILAVTGEATRFAHENVLVDTLTEVKGEDEDLVSTSGPFFKKNKKDAEMKNLKSDLDNDTSSENKM